MQAGAAPIVDGRPEERHARRLRLGDGRHLRQAMVRPCRRGDRGRRPHHRRADRAPGRPRARHAPSRHPRARAANRRRAATSRSPIRASAGAAPTSPIRSRSSRRSTRRSPGRACACCSPRPPARTRSIACSTRALRPVPARDAGGGARRSSTASARTASRRSATVLFMAGAGGSLRAGVTDNPVLLTRSVAAGETRVTMGGAPVYVWPGGGITVMVDVTRMPKGSFGYVPTPAIVAPIEFTLPRDALRAARRPCRRHRLGRRHAARRRAGRARRPLARRQSLAVREASCDERRRAASDEAAPDASARSGEAARPTCWRTRSASSCAGRISAPPTSSTR